MRSWKIFVTFFQSLCESHYSVDATFDGRHFTFVKVNDRFPLSPPAADFPCDIVLERDFASFDPSWQEKGYCENSVLYHVYRDGLHKKYDYVGFLEYDHVLTPGFTAAVQQKLNGAPGGTILSFQAFSFRQLFEQAIMMNPRRREKVTGKPQSRWNCLNVILEDYNRHFGTSHGIGRLAARDCFPICHAFLAPSAVFERVMGFHASIMESGKVEGYHRHNWRSPAGLMERYLAVALALEDVPIDRSIQLEHRDLPVKVVRPDWFRPSAWRRAVAYIQRKF